MQGNISSEIPEKLTKPYNPQETEERIYKQWEESGYFNPDNLPQQGKPYTITLPPPNVTGVLHLGHAYEDSLQDTIIRFQRMCGKKALWVPGTDSAAIATQARVEKNIKKEEGKTRHDLGREELVKRVLEFAKGSEGTILNQVRRMGASLDWDRYAYTLDDKRNEAVFTAFKRMYDAGLIYQGNRIVNWDPKGQTTISDDEVVHEERNAKLYTFKYWADFPISIATTRPETKVGDTAVAVHPNDSRYKKFIGKEYTGEFAGKTLAIRVVADESIDPEYGTGALGVTPAHSNTDWEIAEKNELLRPQVINEYAKMTEEAGPLISGMKVNEAREKIVEWLKSENLLEDEKDIVQNVSTSERTGAVIEPLPKVQWWIDVNKKFAIPHSDIPGIESGAETTLKELMRISVESGAIDMPQERFRKIYFHWIDNLHDWCISRQIWFGHRIPIWYKDGEVKCSKQSPGEGWEQDPDVFDTWFSSALWTFSTLGWPEETKDLTEFHPTSFMSPAYEILSLWVSRMILMSGFHLGQVPFRKVMIHGLVKDKHGRKFSKSLGNGIDPIEMIDRYGADALRMGLLSGAAIGNDIKFDENRVKGYKHFANKLWNITRFVLDNTKEYNASTQPQLTPKDKKNLDTFTELAAEVTKEMEEYKLHLASERLYHYIWHNFADEIIEESKEIFEKAQPEAQESTAWLLKYILANSLKMLHPFMPFVTEELWSMMPEQTKDHEVLMVSRWPSENSA